MTRALFLTGVACLTIAGGQDCALPSPAEAEEDLFLLQADYQLQRETSSRESLAHDLELHTNGTAPLEATVGLERKVNATDEVEARAPDAIQVGSGGSPAMQTNVVHGVDLDRTGVALVNTTADIAKKVDIAHEATDRLELPPIGLARARLADASGPTAKESVMPEAEFHTNSTPQAIKARTRAMMAQILGTLSGRREIEMPRPSVGFPGKSKVALAVLSGLGLGCCGIDRCYMGAIVSGIIKGVTLGGLGIWTLIDFVIILINMLEKADSINIVGFQATFAPESQIDTAFWISIVLLVIKVLGSCCGSHRCFGRGK